MADNWKPYLCNVNGKPASIFVNLGVREAVPISSKPWLIWVWVYFQNPRPDGFSDSDEAPTLYEIEDDLDEHLGSACRAILSGRITTQGRREFYYYGETTEGAQSAIKQAMANFAQYRFDIGCQKDPAWDQYLKVLYPSPADLQRIANMDLIDVFVKHGDVLTVPRDVQHWLYFPSESDREQFGEAVTLSGFRIASESKVEGERPFGISLVRRQSVEQQAMDRTVLELLELAERFDGNYDGWETPVITQ